MKVSVKNPESWRRGERAYTIIEVSVASGLIGMMFVSLYSGIASGFSIVSLSRENLRANQIVLERMETIRLYTWTQISSNGFVPDKFTERFYPPAGTNAGSGAVYYGSVKISDAPVEAGYSNSLKRVQVSVVWTNNSVPRTHEMETLISEFGMQNYIY